MNTYATSITVASYQVPNWQYSGSTAKLRIYSDTSFISSDGTTISAGSPNTNGGFYKEISITISANVATIAGFTIDSTNDGQNTTAARYTAYFYDSTGRRLGNFSPFTQFFVTSDAGNSQTWTQIASYNFIGPAPPSLRYTFDDATIQRMFAEFGSALTNPMTAVGDLIRGGSAGAATRLPIGTAGQFLRTSAGLPTWATIGSSDLAEIIAVTDLTTYAATSGSGTTAIRSTITSPSNGQVLTYQSGNWINSTPASSGNLLSINADTTGAQTLTVNASSFPTLTITDNATGDHKFGLSGPIGVAQGGLGFASATAGDLPYFSGATTLAKLTIGSNNTVLKSNGSVPSWGLVDLTANVTGVLPTANGGLNNAFFAVSGPAGTVKTFTFPNASANILTDNALVTVQQGGLGLNAVSTGDLPYGSASNTYSRLSIGSNNTILRSNGTIPSWGQVVLTTDVSGILPVANGGTGQNSFTAGYLKSNGTSLISLTVPIPIADGGTNNTGGSYVANGLLYYSGSAYATIAAGTTGTVLVGNTGSTPSYTAAPTLTSLTLSGLTQDSLLFAGASGLLSQNNARLSWDNSNFRLQVQDTVSFLGSSSGFTRLKAAAAAGGATFVLPTVDGTNGQVLGTDGSGNLSFITPAGGGGGGSFSLNGLTAAVQTFTVDITGANAPTIDQPTSSQNRLIIPTISSSSITAGLVTNASQTLYGPKSMNDTLSLRSGTTTDAPLVLNCSSCDLLTTPIVGAIETDGQYLYYTQSIPSTTRKQLLYTTDSIDDAQLSANAQLKTEKNANNGYAGLNSSGFVNLAQGGLGIGLTIGSAGTILRSDGTQVAFSTDASALTSINASNISSGTLSNARLSGVELTANKGSADGYAPLNSSTLIDSTYTSETLTVAQLTTYNGVSGSGTTAIASTISAPADGQYLAYNGSTSNWENRNFPASSVHNLLDGVVHPDTIAQTVTRGAIVYGNATPKWASLTVGSVDQILQTDGTDISWGALNLSSASARTGTLPVTNGGTGLTSGTSGGLLYFSAGTTIASSGAYTANAVLYGGGAGSAPGEVTLNATGTNKFLTQVSSGAPSFNAIVNSDIAELLAVTDLTTYSGTSGTGSTAIRSTFTSLTTNDVLTWDGLNWINQAPSSNHDILSATHSDTVAATVVRGDLMIGNSDPAWARVAVDTNNRVLTNDGTDTGWGKVDLASSVYVTGILGATNGGTNNAFFQVSGPATSTKTFTFPNASANVLTDNAVITGAQGGTGVANTSKTITLGGNLVTSGAFNTTLTVTADTNLTLPTSGTLTRTADNLSVFAATSSAQLAGVINDETGSGALVFATSPSFTTPVLGAASATSINGATITSTTGGTLTLANSSTLATSGANSITLTSTGATNVTLPTSGTLVNSAVTTLSSLVSVGTITTGTWSATAIAVDKGGTNTTSYTKGDILVASGATTLTKVGVGTDGHVLTADSGEATGVKWASASGGSEITDDYFTVEREISPITGTATTAGIGTANVVYVIRFPLTRTITVSTIHTYISTGAGSSTGSFGIYTNDGNTRLITSGSIDTSTSGVKSVTLGSPVTLTPGLYLYAFAVSTSTTLRYQSMVMAANGMDMANGDVTTFATAANAASSGVIPSTLGALTPVTSMSPMTAKFQK